MFFIKWVLNLTALLSFFIILPSIGVLFYWLVEGNKGAIEWGQQYNLSFNTQLKIVILLLLLALMRITMPFV